MPGKCALMRALLPHIDTFERGFSYAALKMSERAQARRIVRGLPTTGRRTVSGCCCDDSQRRASRGLAEVPPFVPLQAGAEVVTALQAGHGDAWRTGIAHPQLRRMQCEQAACAVFAAAHDVRVLDSCAGLIHDSHLRECAQLQGIVPDLHGLEFPAKTSLPP